MRTYCTYIQRDQPTRLVPAGSFGETKRDKKQPHTQKSKATMADEENFSYVCAPWAPILGFMGCASAIVFASEFRGGERSFDPYPMLQ